MLLSKNIKRAGSVQIAVGSRLKPKMSNQTEHWYAVGFLTGKGEDKITAIMNAKYFPSRSEAMKWARQKQLRFAKFYKPNKQDTFPKA
jgi:hypothetical protein